VYDGKEIMMWKLGEKRRKAFLLQF
jgi:hypothetical protein